MAAPADEYINIGTEPSDESNSIQAPEGEDEAKVKSFNTKEIENLLESLKNTESILAEKEKAFQSTIDNLAEREKIFNLQEKELEYLKESMKNIQSNTIDSALAEKDKALIQKDIEIQKLTHSLKQAEKRISEQDKEIQQLNEIMKSSEKSSEQDKDIKSLKDILKISEMDQLRKSLKDTEDAFSEKERELNITKQALQKIQENLKQKEKDVIMPRRNYPSQSTASDVLRIQFINKIAQVKDLEKIRAKLESQLKEKTEELNKLQESESSMFEKQTELENRIKMSEKKIEIKDKEKMELTKLLQMTEKKLTDAKKDQDTKYRTDDERLIQLRAELQKLRETTRQQLLDKDSALNAALLSHQDKENRLSNKTAELAKVKSTLQTLEGKLNETAEDLEKCQKPQSEGVTSDDYSSSRPSFGTDVLRLQLVSTYKENKEHKRTIADLETQLRTTEAEVENTKRSNDIRLQEKDSELRVFERNLTLAELKLSEREAELNRLKRSPPEENIRVKRASAGGDWQSKFEKLEKQLNEKETELMEAHESEFVLQANQKKLQKAIRDSSADLKSKENELKALSSVLQQTEELLYERDKELDVKCKSDSQKIAELRAENKELRASKMKGIISTEKELNASAKSLNDCESALETKTARALQTPDALKKENERLRLQLVQKIKELSDLKKGITPTAEAAIPAPTGRADLATQLDAAKKEKDTLQAKLAETILQLKDLKGKMKTGAKSDECKKILQRTMRQLLQKTAEINALQGTGTTLGPTGKTRASTEELYTECKKLLQASMRQLLLKDTEIEKLLAQLKAAAELLRAKEDELKECRDKLGGTGSSGKPSDDQDQEYIECKKLLQASMRQLLVKDIEIGKLIAQLKDAGLSPSSDDAPKDPTKEEEEKALREKVSELKKLLQAAMQELLLKDAELDKVTKQLEEAGDNISKKDKEMDDHRKSDDDRIREARTELQKLQQILEAVEQLLRLKDEELKQLKKQDPGVPTADYEKLKRDVEDKDRALDRKDAEIDSLKDRLREAEKKSAKSEDRDTLEAIQKDIVELLRLKDKELEELRKQGSKSAEQCNKELKDCKAELEKLRRELKSANDAIKNKQTDMDKHVKDDEDQIRETQLERQKIEAIRKNVEEILRRQEPDKDKIEEKDDEIKKLKKALQDLENKLRERESESANCNECMNKLKEKTKEAENKAADLRECERKLREKDKDFDDHKVEDDTRIRQAQSELEKLTNIQKDIEDLLALKNEELVKLREKCKKETNTGG